MKERPFGPLSRDRSEAETASCLAANYASIRGQPKAECRVLDAVTVHYPSARTILSSLPSKLPRRIISSRGMPYQPLQDLSDPPVFLTFSRVRNERDLKTFVDGHGALTIEGFEPHSGESVELGLDSAKLVRRILNRHRLAATDAPIESVSNLARLDVTLNLNGPKPTLSVAATSLLGAMWLQLAESIAGGDKFRQCPFCRNFFAVQSGGGRRKDQLYCSREHQIAANNAKRGKE